MEIDPTTLVLLGVICVALGFIASGLLGTLREEGEPDRSEENPDLAPPGGRKGRYSPVVRLWRERQNNRLIVEIDGRSLVSPERLSPEQRETLESVARDFRGWLGMGLAAYNPPAGVETAAGLPASGMPAAGMPAAGLPAAVAASAAAAENAPPSGTPPSTTAPPPVVTRPYTPPAYSAPIAPARGRGKAEPSPLEEAASQLSASKSIVGQIEDILQDMIAGSPYGNRGIHLIEDPMRGVIVTADGHSWDGIDSVSDPEIKGVVKAAVAEWEKHHG